MFHPFLASRWWQCLQGQEEGKGRQWKEKTFSGKLRIFIKNNAQLIIILIHHWGVFKILFRLENRSHWFRLSLEPEVKRIHILVSLTKSSIVRVLVKMITIAVHVKNNFSTICGQMIIDHQGSDAVQGAWYPIRKGRKGTQDEVHRRRRKNWTKYFTIVNQSWMKVMLATSAVLNGWVLAQEKDTEHCWRRFSFFSQFSFKHTSFLSEIICLVIISCYLE